MADKNQPQPDRSRQTPDSEERARYQKELANNNASSDDSNRIITDLQNKLDEWKPSDK